MSSATRWHVDKRHTFAGADHIDLFTPKAVADRLIVRQLRISTDTAAELVVYFGRQDGDDVDDNRVFGVFLPANGGAAPDLSCLGSWAPKGGDVLRLRSSAAAIVHVAAEGDLDS